SVLIRRGVVAEAAVQGSGAGARKQNVVPVITPQHVELVSEAGGRLVVEAVELVIVVAAMHAVLEFSAVEIVVSVKPEEGAGGIAPVVEAVDLRGIEECL